MHRRWVVGAVAIVCMLGLAGCDWSMFMYGPAHTGNSIDTSLSAADLAGGLTEKWRADVGNTTQNALATTPIVVGSLLYVASRDGHIEAFDAAGNTNCAAGTPKTCQPIWESGQVNTIFASTPAVANGVLYVGGENGFLYAFDATGNTNCIGTGTKTCFALWVSTNIGEIESSPVVANGKVFIGSANGLYAFDAAGQTNCVPVTCSPLFSATTGGGTRSSPAVANNVVYIGSQSNDLLAYDANGQTNCDLTQHTCSPLWAGVTGDDVLSSPAVAGGVVYVGSDDGKFYVFDAAGGASSCSGTRLRTCTPLWTANPTNAITASPAVSKGVVYISTQAGGSVAARLNAYDAAGNTNCSGVPKVCTPLWSSGDLSIIGQSPVSVANGVVYVILSAGIFQFVGSVYAFDATAPSTHCSGTPKICTPLWTGSPGGVDALGSAPTIANGFVYALGATLHAYGK